MKTEQEIKGKQIEIQGELMNIIEAKMAFSSSFNREPTEEETDAINYRIVMLEHQLDIINWMLS